MRKLLRNGSARGVLVLGILAIVTAGLLAGPVTAAGTLTKKKVKKIATKVVNQYGANNLGIFARSTPGPIPMATTNATVGSVSLPAGQYALFGKGWFTGESNPDVSCELVVGGAVVDYSQTELISTEGAPKRAELTVMGAASVGGTTTAELRCMRDPAGTATGQNFQLVVIRGPSLA